MEEQKVKKREMDDLTYTMDYRLQIVKIFTRKRHLSNEGLNLKLNLEPHHVTKEDY